jgi:hypothetical protein
MFTKGGNQICEHCIKGKQHRLPFGRKKLKKKEKVKLIHMDRGGPMEVPSYGGSRYIATFIDDLTRP